MPLVITFITLLFSSFSAGLDKGDSADVGEYGLDEGFKGPWARYADEIAVAKPTEEQIELMAQWADQDDDSALTANTKKPKAKKDAERSVLHVKDDVDYQGRTYMHPPQDIGKLGAPPAKCFLPKKEIHTWTGHTKGVAATRFFPNSGHLLLSCGMDSKIKLWEFYGKRRCLRTFHGHSQAVRDITFTNSGDKFLSCGTLTLGCCCAVFAWLGSPAGPQQCSCFFLTWHARATR